MSSPAGGPPRKPREISAAKAREYDELRAFLDLYATCFLRIDPNDPAHPGNTATRMLEVLGKAKVLQGLRMAVQDSMESFQDYTPEQIAQLDAILKARGIVSVSELRHRYSRKYKGILKRGVIRNEGEYYLVKAIVDDGFDALADEELAHLGAMLLDFETRIARARGSHL